MQTNDRYLFRGKRLDNGEWVEGFLSSPHTIKVSISKNPNSFLDYDEYEIQSSTISQFTTLTDKNGERIWEQDFVKCPKGGTFVILWRTDYGRWVLNGWEPTDLEVLRSIHDTPVEETKQ